MTADIYDALYANKDYETEAKRVKELVGNYCKSGGRELLDMACGTGLHLPYLIGYFDVTGVDLSKQQVEKARQRLPDINFVQGDMKDVDLHHQFDAVTCLFSSIGYVRPLDNMHRAVANMAEHLKPGGVLLIEPWLQPGVYDPNHPVEPEVGVLPEKGLKVIRTPEYGIEGNVSVINMHHEVEQNGQATEFTEEHRLAMYTTDEFRQAFLEAGLSFDWLDDGLTEGRGLCIGTKPLVSSDK